MQHLTPKQLRSHLDNGAGFTLLDVREPDEVAICRLENAVHIPMFPIPEKRDEVKQLQPVVVFCHHGIRSVQVCHYLKQEGILEVYNLAGGIARWAGEIEPDMPRY